MQKYYANNNHHFILTFHKSQVTFFSIIEFTAEDESGISHKLYGEQSGVVLNDVIDGITMYDTECKHVNKADYLRFMDSLDKLEMISEADLSKKTALSIHGDYADPF